jgi:hypothetical protein
MAQPARLTRDLLARKGEAVPIGGFARPAIDWHQPLPGPAAPRIATGAKIALASARGRGPTPPGPARRGSR